MLPDWEDFAMFWPEVLTLLVICLLLFLVCVWLAARAEQPKQRRPKAKTSLNYQLQKRLLTLLKGDVPTAKRLLAQQRQRNPGRSDNWYLEKVIYDLERDRRC
jgi:uncharacterized Tic20 family protein